MKWLLVWSVAWGLAACQGVSPRPEQMAANLPPARQLDQRQLDQVAGHTTTALSLLGANDLDGALREADAALSLDPRAARARAVRARCQMAQAQADDPPTLAMWRRAEGELLIAERLAPTDIEVGLLHAEFLEADGHLTAAAERLDGLLAYYPEDPRCWREAGRLRFELGEERAAAPKLERLLVLDPDDHVSLYRLAECRRRLAPTDARELDEAEAKLALYDAASNTFARYREAVPDDVAGYMGEGFSRFEAWRIKPDDGAGLAVVGALFTRASEVAPDLPAPMFNLGVVKEAAADSDGARAAYEAALSVDPQHLPSLLNLAANLQAAGPAAAALTENRTAPPHGPRP